MLGPSKPLITGLAAVALVLALATAGLLVRELHSMINEASGKGKGLSDAEWTVKIEKVTAETNKRIADQATVAVYIQADAAKRVSAA